MHKTLLYDCITRLLALKYTMLNLCDQDERRQKDQSQKRFKSSVTGTKVQYLAMHAKTFKMLVV